MAEKSDPKRMVQFNFRLEAQMKAVGEESAKADHRDLTSLLRKLLEDHLKAEGRWPPASEGKKR